MGLPALVAASSTGMVASDDDFCSTHVAAMAPTPSPITAAMPTSPARCRLLLAPVWPHDAIVAGAEGALDGFDEGGNARALSERPAP